MSRLSASALSEELDRRDKIAALDTYLRDLDVELGPVSSDEQVAAEEWANRGFGDPKHQKPGRANRTA